jgi:hypothetical protein
VEADLEEQFFEEMTVVTDVTSPLRVEEVVRRSYCVPLPLRRHLPNVLLRQIQAEVRRARAVRMTPEGLLLRVAEAEAEARLLLMLQLHLMSPVLELLRAAMARVSQMV